MFYIVQDKLSNHACCMQHVHIIRKASLNKISWSCNNLGLYLLCAHTSRPQTLRLNNVRPAHFRPKLCVSVLSVPHYEPPHYAPQHFGPILCAPYFALYTLHPHILCPKIL